MGSRSARSCQTARGSILPEERKHLPDHGVPRRRYLAWVSYVWRRRWKRLTRCSGMLNATGTSKDAGTMKLSISCNGFLIRLEICVSKCLVTDRRFDDDLTWNCTKAAGMFFLSKRTLTQHGPICAKRSWTASVRSLPLRVRSRLARGLVKTFVRMYS